jgi:glycosyltransferase involved in cell wall biosynthesis
MMLSILIPSIPERNKRLKKSLKDLMIQINYCRKVHPILGEVEVIIDDSKRFKNGGPSIGSKRQAMVERAEGKYLCFKDDDDLISPDYIETLLRLCRQGKDICTFNNISMFDNYWCIVQMSISNKEDEQAKPGLIKRKPWHICPVKSEIAKSCKFPDSNYGEDRVWLEQLLPKLNSEAHTESIIHLYRHSVKTSEADNLTTAI